MSKRLFVTGATGYIGPRLVEAAVKDGYSVRGLSRSEAGDAKVVQAGGTPVRGKRSCS
jgi:nucleoside-diphosphate-sugar epimerase